MKIWNYVLNYFEKYIMWDFLYKKEMDLRLSPL